MTVSEIISMVDSRKANRVSTAAKIDWLSNLDGQICRDVFETHEGNPVQGEFIGYVEGRDEDRQLLVPFPYNAVYRWYLESQIDLANTEINTYTQSSTMFTNEYRAFADYWNRTHMPISTAGRFSFTELRKAGEADALSS